MLLPKPVLRPDEHLGDDHDDQRERHAGAQADEGLRKRFQQHHQQDLRPPRAHQPGGQQPRLARVHDAVGDIEDDRERGREGRHIDLGLVVDAEQQQEQREDRRRGRRAEEIDDEFERAIEPLRRAEDERRSECRSRRRARSRAPVRCSVMTKVGAELAAGDSPSRPLAR